MALQEIPLPIQGVNYGYPLDKLPGTASPYMNNVRPFDVLENRIRLGQRPGINILYTQQIGGDINHPIVAIGQVTVVD